MTCPVDHDAIRRGELRGVDVGVMDLDDGEPLRLINCPTCQTTLAVPVEPTREAA